MRQYEKVVNTWTDNKGIIHEDKRLNRGLKKVHIGDDVWLFGRQNHVPDKGQHMVIYGPNRKEYHVWGDDVHRLRTHEDSDCYDFWGYCNRNGNRAIESKVKIYILTTILSEPKSWCFDLKKRPKNGFLKVIYENGTIKNIEFDGKFKPIEILVRENYSRKVSPVGYYKSK